MMSKIEDDIWASKRIRNQQSLSPKDEKRKVLKKRTLHRRYTAQLSISELRDVVGVSEKMANYNHLESQLPKNVLYNLALDMKRKMRKRAIHMAIFEKPELQRWDSADYFLGLTKTRFGSPSIYDLDLSFSFDDAPRGRSASFDTTPCSPA